MTTPVFLAFDERMALHAPIGSPALELERLLDQDMENMQQRPDHFVAERPARIFAIYNALHRLEYRLRQRCFVNLPCIPACKNTICLAHSSEHYQRMRATSWLTDRQLKELEVENDLYFSRHTFEAACLAVGGVVQCVNAVTSSEGGATRAIAVVRPPGHHALRDSPMGFCYFNNIAIAAKHALHTGRAKRVFILDWDIHHGNGIQDLTADNPNIFYLSIHRHGHDQPNVFYPGTGHHYETGQALGVGTNLNIAWERNGMGNAEYAGAFAELVLPVMSSFDPDLIVVACGLDAAKGDLLGDCGLSPLMYHVMMESVLEAVGSDIPVVVALEGGYNLPVISECMQAVALALLDEPFDDNEGDGDSLSRYWSHSELCLKEETNEACRIKNSAVKSIKKSARSLAKSRVSQSAPIQTPRYANMPGIDPEQKQHCHRMTLIESDRYPVKKQILLRAVEEA